MSKSGANVYNSASHTHFSSLCFQPAKHTPAAAADPLLCAKWLPSRGQGGQPYQAEWTRHGAQGCRQRRLTRWGHLLPMHTRRHE
eukprot:1150190-Pelagomonas_calceolata.AAC.6